MQLGRSTIVSLPTSLVGQSTYCSILYYLTQLVISFKTSGDEFYCLDIYSNKSQCQTADILLFKTGTM